MKKLARKFKRQLAEVLFDVLRAERIDSVWVGGYFPYINILRAKGLVKTEYGKRFPFFRGIELPVQTLTKEGRELALWMENRTLFKPSKFWIGIDLANGHDFTGRRGAFYDGK